MAGCTIAAHDTQVMDKSSNETSKGGGIVARRTVKVRIDMTRGLADADITIMAGQAVAGICAGMVECGASKGGGVMAVVALLVARGGRYVIQQFTYTNPVVMARRAAASSDTDMIKGASAKCSRSMAGTAIFTGRHVSIERRAQGHAARGTRAISNMTGNATISLDAGMIDAKCWEETLGIMARSTIGCSEGVAGHRGRFGGCVDTGIVVVT